MWLSFFSSFENINVNHLDDCIPSDMFEDWRIDILVDEESYKLMEYFDHSVEKVKVTEITKCDKNKAKDSISREY